MEIDKNIKFDQDGHLLDFKKWNHELARSLADVDGFELSQQHFLIIDLVRDIYLQSETTPPMRILIKAIRNQLGPELANSRKLYQLFPEGPVRYASKYAGLPKPKHCM